MKTLIAAAAAASALALAAPASAEIYANLGYSAVDLGKANVGAVTGRLGWKFNDVLGVEGEASTGIDDDKMGTTKVELDSQFALYGTASVPVSDTISAFARVGYGWQTVGLNPGGSDSEHSWNYGVGGQWMFAGPNGVRVDYTRVDFDGDQAFRDSDVWTVSYVRKF